MKNIRPIPTVLLVIFSFYAAVVTLYAGRFGFHPSGFACIGDQFAFSDLPPASVVIADSEGYDGQFFLYAARNPLIRQQRWGRMDVPAYRYGRILYPWLAALLALGNTEWIPLLLIIVNLAAVLMGSFFVARMLARGGKSPWYACVYGLLSGFILCVLRDLAAPVAMGFLVGGIYFFSHRKPCPGAVFFAAALLAKEVVIVVPLIYLLFALLDRRRDPGRLGALAASFVPFLLWIGYVFFRFRDRPWRGGAGNFGAPLEGMISYGRTLLTAGGRWSEKSYLLILLAVSLLTLYLAVREFFREKDEVSLCFLVYALFPLFLTGSVWVEPWSYGRVLLPGAVLLIVNFARSRDRLFLYPLFGHLLLTGIILWWVGIV